MEQRIGKLMATAALKAPELISPSIQAALQNWPGGVSVNTILVAEVDPDFSDTDAFAAHYGYDLTQAANCLIVMGRRGDDLLPAACLVPAHARADINGLVRRTLGARRVSMADRDFAVSASGQEYGSITILGLPKDWSILIDTSLIDLPLVLVGGGLRKSKLLIPGAALAEIPGAVVADLVKP